MSANPPPSTHLSERPPLLDEATLRRLNAQLPDEGGELLQGYNAMARETPMWLGLTVIGIVLGGQLLAGVLPELSANVLYIVWTLWLAMLVRKKTLEIRSAEEGSPDHERLGGQRWLLVGVLVLFLPQPTWPPAGAVAAMVKWPLALVVFGIGFERLVLRSRRAARATRRT